jgi:hypothetical protein
MSNAPACVNTEDTRVCIFLCVRACVCLCGFVCTCVRACFCNCSSVRCCVCACVFLLVGVILWMFVAVHIYFPALLDLAHDTRQRNAVCTSGVMCRVLSLV